MGADENNPMDDKIHQDTLTKVIKEEFNMTIDIERLIMELDTGEEGLIEYDEFKSLLAD